MFWRQHELQQHYQQQQQHQEQQQQHQHQQHRQQKISQSFAIQNPTRRFNISFNLKIAVNVNTKMSGNRTRNIQQESCKDKPTTNDWLDWTKTNLSRLVQMGGHGGISTILIINLLLLILLSICCDVCRSHDGQQLPSNYTNARIEFKDQFDLLPKLDSDVVEKVAIWHNHAAAAPPSIVEGIAISTIARPISLNRGSTYATEKEKDKTSPDLVREVEDDGSVILGVGMDERIALERVTRDCVQRCIVEEDLFLDEFGIKCEKADNSDKCYKTRCTKGCAQWYRALKELEPCQEACSSLQFYPNDLPCIGACEMAQRDYWHLQRLAIAELVKSTQPQFVRAPSQDQQSTPLILKWDMHFPENYLASRPFNIQYKYANELNVNYNNKNRENSQVESEVCTDNANVNPNEWFNLADYDCDEYYVCEILETLMPYTQYRFRFELPFGESSEEILYSPPSPVYQTPAENSPISAPIIDHLFALDDSHVAVHWHAGRFINGPIKGYRIRLTSNAKNQSQDQLVPAHRDSHVFAQLQPRTNYTLELSMVNEEGEGPAAKASIMTKLTAAAGFSKDQGLGALLVGRNSIVWQALELAGESRVVYRSQQSIVDAAWAQRDQRLYILDTAGELRTQTLDQAPMMQVSTLVVLQGFPNDSAPWIPQKIGLDSLKNRLYMAVEIRKEVYGLVKSNPKGAIVEVLVEDLNLPIQQLEVDALNGWIFWTDAQGLWRLDLASKQRLQLYKTANPLGRFVLDAQHWLIHLLLPDETQILELTYDGNWQSPMGLSPGHWKTLTLLGKSLLLAGDNHIHLMVWPTMEKISQWSLREVPDYWALIPLIPDRQQIALDTGVPRDLIALLGSQAAEISWKEPDRNAYQSLAAANNLSYELEVLDVASQSAYNIRNIRSPNFGLERLQPDNLYQLRVRAMNAVGKVGDWTLPYVARTWPLGPHRLRWSTQSGELYETNELGQNLEKKEIKLEPRPGALAMMNASSGYYVGGDRVMRCINLEQPHLKCLVDDLVPHVGAVAYDWRGGRVYWTDLGRNCVVRLDPLTGIRELLSIFGAKDLVLDSQQGHLYYTTAMHLMRRGLSPQPGQNDEVEYYHLNGLEGSINSLTLDIEQRYVYWTVQASEDMRLYRSPLVVGNRQTEDVELLATLPHMKSMPKSLQLLQPLGALLWLEGSGCRGRVLRLPVGQETMPLIAHGLKQPASAVQLIDANSPPIPDSGVIPLTIPPDSLRIDDGHWDDFHVRWQPAGSEGNHTVSYRLLLEYGHRLQTHDLSTPFARIVQLPQAHLNIKVCLTPHTSWRAGSTTCVQLTTPAAAPTQPRRLRVFVERRASPLQTTNISALLRWDAPEQAPAQALEYHISCWQGTELYSELLLNQSALEARVEQLQPEETYRFQVEAHVASSGAAAGAASHSLHVAPEVQAVPRLLYVNSEFIGELDLDTRSRRQIVYTSSPVEHMAVMEGEQRLLWVNEHVELLTHVPGSAPAKLARMRAEVLALTVDWVQRMVYWAELDAVAPQAAIIYRLNLCHFEGRILQGERMWSTPRGHLLRDLVALPHSQILVWLEHELDSRNATLQGRSLVNGSHIPFEISPRTSLSRLYEGSLEPGAETLNLVDHLGRLCVYDVARQLCTVTALRTQLNFLTDDIKQLAQDSGYLYALRNGSVRAYGRRRQQLEYLVELEKEDVRLLQAHNYQAYPVKRCLLLPPMASLDEVHCEETQCLVKLPALYAASECLLPIPGLVYTLMDESSQGEALHQWKGSSGDTINITDLQPYTTYQLRVSLTSYYQKRSGLEALQLPTLEMQTAPDRPTEPRNFTARVLSPSEVEVSWLEPRQLRSEGVYYMLHWELEEDNPDQGERRIESSGVHRLAGLQPGSNYQLWLQAHATPTKFNNSARLHVKTFEGLPDLQLIELGPYGFNLSWEGTTDQLSSLFLECQSSEGKFQLDVLDNYTRIVVEHLEPKQRYECHLALSYTAVRGPIVVYHAASQVYETLGDAPSAPGKPQLEHIAGEIFRVSWSRARENGAPILLYNLEALQARRSHSSRRRRRDVSLSLLPWAEEPMVVEDQWINFCNTTELSCIVRELHTNRLLLFRVRARNEEHGWGPYSEDSERIAEPFVSPEKRGSLVLAIIAPAAIVSSCVLALVLVRKVQKRRVRAKKLLQQSRPSIWSNLSTLQTQQQLMAVRNRGFSVTLSDADIALLPQISWSQLKLIRFLGSGAFGEVYEGELQVESEAQPQRVAIKSLRKGDSEFAELLQEAQLMSNFKHENIVCLIGICFDTDSISLIMEHMEAGDLLSYLRAARSNSQQPQPGLILSDLITMCIDVANGCTYLEDMHFVHRDLACRNCLVTETQVDEAGNSRRMVKIGDFGLARDIYKSDYYRKEGEGLLPVRWMSPESLVDGVFTTQSDVWAFGVLCWEILTLGQQPYAARNNFEVLAHVKEGGRLQQPENIPDKLYALLVQCWRTDPWERPSFKRCFNSLHAISTDLRRSQMPPKGDPSGTSSSNSASTTSTSSNCNPSNGCSIKPDMKVHFDEEAEQLALHSVSTSVHAIHDAKLYANEGISRL